MECLLILPWSPLKFCTARKSMGPDLRTPPSGLENPGTNGGSYFSLAGTLGIWVLEMRSNDISERVILSPI